MENKKNWFQKNDNFLKTQIFILILVIISTALISYHQYNKHLNNIEKIVLNSNSNKKLEKLIDNISVQNDSLKFYGDKEYYSLSKDILTARKELATLKTTVDEKYKGWLSYFGSFWAIMGLILATITVFVSFKEKLKKEVDEKVKIEVNNIVPLKVAEITDSKIKVIKKEYKQIEKHINYRKDAKILIINEGTEVPLGFNKVMTLFNDADGIPIERLTIPNLVDLKNSYEKFLEYDLLIIENHIVENWIIDNRHLSVFLKDINKDIKAIEESDLNKPEREIQLESLNKKHKFEKDRINQLAKINNKHLSDLANNICINTAIVYKGLGQFPIDDVGNDKVHLITFANAFSQLYGNILSMLKFKNEIETN